MPNTKLLLSLLSVVAVLAFNNRLAVAQARPESDLRFEKLAKEFYPKAKQEGALVVYTVWDVDHIRSLQALLANASPASILPIGRRRDRKSRRGP